MSDSRQQSPCNRYRVRAWPTSSMLLVSTTRIIPRRTGPSLPSGRYSAVKVRKKLYVTALRSYGCVLHSWRAGLAREQFAGGRGGARTNRERARLGANESRTGAVGRERIANGRGWARTNRERARLGAAGRKLRFEVHESAAFFTAGNLPLLKKRLKPLLGGSFRNT